VETITGTAAGVPYTALPPATDGPAPLLVTWHMLDAPRTDAAFAAALPLAGVPAWRVHLGLPLCGARTPAGGIDAIIELARRDALTAFLAPIAHQAAAEFPAALAALREQLPVADGPVGILGGSLGGTVALAVLTAGQVPIRAAALVNPAVRVESVVPLVGPQLTGSDAPYAWTAQSRATADGLDFVARAGEIPAGSPLLLVSGDEDHPALRADVRDLVAALGTRAELRTVPELAHPLADEPGLEPAPQRPTARAVDAILTDWFRRRLADGR
jgi:dienelactone hydrolase